MKKYLLITLIFFFSIHQATHTNEYFKTYLSYKGGNDGLGYHSNYASLDLMCFPLPLEDITTFSDLKGHWLTRHHYAVNAGVGFRKIYAPQTIWDANLFYDHPKSSYDHYNQAGLGLELFHELWELRLNGAVALGHTTKRNKTFVYTDVFFVKRHFHEYAFLFVEAELGKKFIFFDNISPFMGIRTYYT